ncbi:MAG: hypothetical protein ACRD3R_04970 [Terriglobales bacterium]
MGIVATLFVWILGFMFVTGLLGASLVLMITFVEDLKMLFEDSEENVHISER